MHIYSLAFKKLPIAILLLMFSNYSFSQGSFLIKKGEPKINIDGATVKLLSSEQFEYQQPGSAKKNKVKVNEIERGVLGNFHIEAFKIDGKQRSCFVIAEMPGKKLVGYNIKLEVPYNQAVTGQSKTSVQVKYYYYIMDESNKVLETMQFTKTYGEKFAKERDIAEAALRNHFSDCDELIGRLNEHDAEKMNLDNASKAVKEQAKKFDEGNFKLIKLFDNPKYSLCTKADNAPVATNATEEVAVANQEYSFGVMTFEMAGTKKDLPVKGTFSINDGHLTVTTKDNSVKYKIIGNNGGVLSCADKDMVHKVTIVPEQGKTKGFAYDTKISFAVDKKMGGSTALYWSKKQ